MLLKPPHLTYFVMAALADKYSCLDNDTGSFGFLSSIIALMPQKRWSLASTWLRNRVVFVNRIANTLAAVLVLWSPHLLPPSISLFPLWQLTPVSSIIRTLVGFPSTPSSLHIKHGMACLLCNMLTQQHGEKPVLIPRFWQNLFLWGVFLHSYLALTFGSSSIC